MKLNLQPHPRLNMRICYSLGLLFAVAFLLPLFGSESELLLKENLSRAHPGDYLVTVQNKNYTLLAIRNKDEQFLNIEEITMPASRVPSGSFSWKNWVEKGAPGNTCWIMYTIHLPSGSVQQTFSFTKNEWMTVPQSQHFLSTLLNLPLRRIPDRERKKIGPPPATDHPDRRAHWQPRLIVEGQNIQGVAFEAWRARWPKDGSELANKVIEIYIPQESEKYPSYFPYWLQVYGAVGNAKIRIVDSGTALPIFQKLSTNFR